MPEGPFFDGAWRSSHDTKSAVARLRRLRSRASSRPLPPATRFSSASRSVTCCAIVPVPVIQRSRALPVRLTRACARSGGIVRSCARQLFLVGGRERKGVRPELDDRVVGRPLVRGRVALVGPQRLVVRGIARPRAQHAQIEVEPVHQRADERVIDLLLDRPALRIDALPAVTGTSSASPAARRPRRAV